MKLRHACLVFALCIGLLAGLANAQTGVATVSWVAPTQNTDGSAIPAGELTGYTVNWSQCAGTAPAYTMGTISGTASVAASALSYATSTLTTTWTVPHCFTVIANATVTDPTTGLPKAVSSVPSAVVFKQITAPPAVKIPASPSGVAVK